jgi:hypothetical protein
MKSKHKDKGSSIVQVVAEEAKWVEDMRTHFQETGSYRAEDIQRLAGDPRESFSTPPPKNPLTNFMALK